MTASDEPTMDRDGFDMDYVLRAAELVANGGQGGHVPTVMGHMIDGYHRRCAEIERLREQLNEESRAWQQLEQRALRVEQGDRSWDGA